MNKWRVEVTKSALDELKNLPVDVRTKIRELVRQMANEDCPAVGSRKLHEIDNVFVRRVGRKYRILFCLKTNEISVEDNRGVLLILAVVWRKNMGKIILRSIK